MAAVAVPQGKNSPCWMAVMLALLALVAAATARPAPAKVMRGGAVGCAGGDWWAGIKSPDGTDFSVYDGEGSFSVAEDMTDTSSHPAQTLAALYAGGSGLNYVMYNDETPAGHKSSTRGHTKGVVAFDESSGKGFWLVHSIPRWPPVQADGYSVPTDTQKYGQSFLCMSFNVADLDTAANLMQLNYPQIYDSHFSASGQQQAPHLYELSKGNHTTAATTATQALPTSGGSSFRQFAKTARWGQAIGEYLIGPYYDSGFQWETWRDGEGDLQPWCAGKGGCQYDTFDVESVKVPSGTTWTVSRDHSKWGISTDGAKVACIGDINRQSGQYRRGGGFVCKSDSGLWKAFNQIITGTNSTCTPCP